MGSLIHAGTALGSRMIVAENCRELRVDGLLNLSHDSVSTSKTAWCAFYLRPEWIEEMPVVFCLEDWTIREIDWHMNEQGWVCYELPERWTDTMRTVAGQEGVACAAKFGAVWCLESVKWLLYRHYFASITGLRKWPASWPQWPHGRRAQDVYEAEKNKIQRAI
jgi:hypothetical protein